MMPIGPLMIEHRWIERMIQLMARELARLEETGRADVEFLDAAVDFIRTYADRCHHGKEEDILFKALREKNLTPELKRILEELIREHAWGRKTVGSLVQARKQYASGETAALDTLRRLLGELVEFYPRHIEKEDKHFFLPVMEYFSQAEKDALLEAGYDFDRQLIHEKYRHLVQEMEAAGTAPVPPGV